VFAVDAERAAAGGHHPQRGNPVEQVDDEPGHLAGEVLAVVEHQGSTVQAQPLDERLVRVPGEPGDADRRGDRRDQEGRVGHIGEPDDGVPPGPFHGQAGLARPGRPDDGDEPMHADETAQQGQVGVAADERRQRPITGHRGRDAGGHQGRVLCQDPAFELPQLRSGVDTQFLGQQGPDPAHRVQGVGLASRTVERQRQQLPTAFAVRRGVHQKLEHGHRTGVVAGGQQRRGALLLGAVALFYQGGTDRGRRLVVSQILVRCSAPQPQRRVEGLVRIGAAATCHQRTGADEVAAKPFDVGVGGKEPIAAGGALQRRARQHPAQPGDVHLHGAHGIAWPAVTPQSFGQAVLRDRPPFRGDQDAQ
jgi:hypothetical protein